MNQESRKEGKNLRNTEITRQIIAAAIRVHRELRPGFLESIYEEALAVEFALSGIQLSRQHSIPPLLQRPSNRGTSPGFPRRGNNYRRIKGDQPIRGHPFRDRAQLSKKQRILMTACF